MRKNARQLPQTGELQIAASEQQTDVVESLPRPAPVQRRRNSTRTRSADSAPASSQQEERASSLPDLNYLLDFFYRTPAAVIMVGEQFNVHGFNPSALTKLGFSGEEVHARSCKDVLMCRNANGTLLCGTSHCPLVRVLQQGETISAEELSLGAHPDFSAEYSVDIVSTCVESRPSVVFAARDLSALRVANQVRANFVSMVSHELRTPLNSVHGFIDLMIQGHMGALTEEQHKYLGYAQEGVLQLMAIVEDILFMTRSDSGQFEMKPQKVNARVLARQVVTSLRFQALKAQVILDKDIPTPAPDVYADPQRLKQVLNNLVTNAIKFTPPEGTVTIRVRPHKDNKVLFSVIDTGYGIPPDDQPHVFERFYQSNHALQSKMGGYGLGLSIARLIVMQHGGEISFESTPVKDPESEQPHGTTFYFTVPVYSGQNENI
ncbi:MAG TPA: HAMP domain-containing sensor histidine kinase [Ktedonobacteraceae bacterium]|nr:HAMP domain-containing sensor histidine kinase [Ktedonobacteraceae bacterium]